MRLADPVKISYKNLMAAKFRSFLTVLGIIIGVASVIVVMAIGASAQALILDQVSRVGSNLIGILPGASEEKGPPATALGVVITTLKYEDLRAILEKKNAPNIESASGYVTGSTIVKRGGSSFVSSFQGVSASILEVEAIDLKEGRFFTKEEDTNLARVAVLGANRAEELFANENPIGKTLSIKDLNFTIVGVFEKRGSVAFSNPDDLVYVPLFTGQKLLLGINHLNFIRAKVDNVENINRTVVDVKTTLRLQHKIKEAKEDDFSVRNTAQALQTLGDVTNVLKYFLASIAAISLLVGGVGIMNIMLIAVNQRIREIGLRKAVGARGRHIISQFLIEAVAITLAGGILGIIIGVAVAYLAALVIGNLGYDWQFIVTWQSIILATSVTVFIGLLFGIYPAIRAAKVSPMEALRYE